MDKSVSLVNNTSLAGKLSKLVLLKKPHLHYIGNPNQQNGLSTVINHPAIELAKLVVHQQLDSLLSSTINQYQPLLQTYYSPPAKYTPSNHVEPIFTRASGRCRESILRPSEGAFILSRELFSGPHGAIGDQYLSTLAARQLPWWTRELHHRMQLRMSRGFG